MNRKKQIELNWANPNPNPRRGMDGEEEEPTWFLHHRRHRRRAGRGACRRLTGTREESRITADGDGFPIFRQVQDNYRFGRKVTRRSGFKS